MVGPRVEYSFGGLKCGKKCRHWVARGEGLLLVSRHRYWTKWGAQGQRWVGPVRLQGEAVRQRTVRELGRAGGNLLLLVQRRAIDWTIAAWNAFIPQMSVRPLHSHLCSLVQSQVNHFGHFRSASRCVASSIRLLLLEQNHCTHTTTLDTCCIKAS